MFSIPEGRTVERSMWKCHQAAAEAHRHPAGHFSSFCSSGNVSSKTRVPTHGKWGKQSISSSLLPLLLFALWVKANQSKAMCVHLCCHSVFNRQHLHDNVFVENATLFSCVLAIRLHENVSVSSSDTTSQSHLDVPSHQSFYPVLPFSIWLHQI